jgi:hypothetical protein
MFVLNIKNNYRNQLIIFHFNYYYYYNFPGTVIWKELPDESNGVTLYQLTVSGPLQPQSIAF